MRLVELDARVLVLRGRVVSVEAVLEKLGVDGDMWLLEVEFIAWVEAIGVWFLELFIALGWA